MALLLGQKGAHVITGIRHPSEGVSLKKEIEQAAGNGAGPVDILELDLASLPSVRAFAAQVTQILKQKNKKIDVLVNNAGILGVNSATVDGYQKVWQVNAMAPAYLTNFLLPLL